MNNTATILVFALWICAVLYLFWPEIQEIFKQKNISRSTEMKRLQSTKLKKVNDDD